MDGTAGRRFAAAGSMAMSAAWAPSLALACALGYCERRHTAWAWRAGRPALAAWFDAATATPLFQATMPPISGL